MNQLPNTEERHARLAKECDQAAAALEEQPSTTNDARLRHEHGEEIQQLRKAAAFYRSQADKLQSEA